MVKNQKNNRPLKVEVVTWLGNGNYGTALQSYALCAKLRQLGYKESLLLPFDNKNIFKSFVKWVLSWTGIIQKRQKKAFVKSKALEKLYNFQQENYHLDRFYLGCQIDRMIKRTDAFISGSDQIWNAWYSFSPHNFLDFAKEKKRIAYASSIGTNDFPEEYKPQIKALLSKYSHIGVRETTGAKAISALLGRYDVMQVVDPTFLLNAEEWRRLAQDAVIEFKLPDKYIFCYFLGNNPGYLKQLSEVKEVYGITDVIMVPATENKQYRIPDATTYMDAGPKEFVYLIQHAALVCTDSFHATAFSINSSINFVHFVRCLDSDTASQNSRIYDSLSHYNLVSHIYNKDSALWHETIDYTPVQAQLSKDRERSEKFLINAIEN